MLFRSSRIKIISNVSQIRGMLHGLPISLYMRFVLKRYKGLQLLNTIDMQSGSWLRKRHIGLLERKWMVRVTDKGNNWHRVTSNTWVKQWNFIDKCISCMSKINKWKHVTRNRERGSQREAFCLSLNSDKQIWGPYIKISRGSFASLILKIIIYW